MLYKGHLLQSIDSRQSNEGPSKPSNVGMAKYDVVIQLQYNMQWGVKNARQGRLGEVTELEFLLHLQIDDSTQLHLHLSKEKNNRSRSCVI